MIATLASAEKAAIALVFIAGGKLPIPVNSDAQTSSALELLGATLGQVKAALGSLDDSLLKRVHDGVREYWTFRHPTVRDSYASLVGDDPELIDVYLAGVSTEQLLNEVTCGETKLEGVKIIVPPERYDIVMTRLDQFVRPSGQWSDPVKSFLGNRCSSEFLAKYYSNNEHMSSLPAAIWYLGAYDDNLKILKKLKRAGILKEEIRLAAVKRIISICERDYSCQLVESISVKDLLTLDETKETITRVVNTLLATGDTIVEDIRDDWNKEDDPDDIFREIKRTLDFIEEDDRFSEDQKSDAAYLFKQIDALVIDMKSTMKESSYESLDAEKAVATEAPTGRSIFDDVDE